MAIELQSFEAGKGINRVKLNSNFQAVANEINRLVNEQLNLDDEKLAIDASNITQQLINAINNQTPIELDPMQSVQTLASNVPHHLTIELDTTFVLPTAPSQFYEEIAVYIDNTANKVIDLGTSNIYNVDVFLTSGKILLIYTRNPIDSTWGVGIMNYTN